MGLKTTRIVVIIQKSLDDMAVNPLEEQLSIIKKGPYTEVKEVKGRNEKPIKHPPTPFPMTNRSIKHEATGCLFVTKP